MLMRIRRQIEQAASLKALLVLFVCLLPFNLVFFPARSQRLTFYLGYQTTVLDSHFYTPPQDVYRYFSDLGAPGRQLYAISEVTLDILYPLLYGIFLSLLIAWLCSRLFPASSRLRWLPLLPLAGALADLGENLSITALLLAYPSQLPWLIYLANLFGLLKWAAVLSSLALILLGAGLYALNRVSNGRKVIHGD